MSMILFAYVARVTDGLPLSASTDFECSRELQECKKQLKVVSKMLGQFPGRGTVKNNQLHIHFTSSQGIAYMTICCSYYPTTMAFCFLEELGMEFISSFEIAKIHMVSRPYAFLEFDSTIQKIKWHYNYSNRPSIKISVTNIQRELKVTPPRQVNMDDIIVSNGTLNGHLLLQSSPAPSYRLEPVSAVGILSVILNIMCGALNLIRGVHLIEHNFQDGDEEKGSVIAFLIAFITCVFQFEPSPSCNHEDSHDLDEERHKVIRKNLKKSHWTQNVDYFSLHRSLAFAVFVFY
ncbi:vesicle-trafficking protein SEC22c isoform X2 [Chiloscyllium plagiosum]|uniref:vesicle-trafficking protein SEC22c isoform X2 n=1 Tax=Chiloscyllium plagiosum TaxID=36176 RepID=UPI001CB7E503|nr:vesicle-trafficking protein SEC22c isoform X2 [Chiloscyllium plagiosum]